MNWKYTLPLLAALALTTGAQAQDGFGGHPPGGFGGGGFQPSPRMQARFQAWQTWRDTHKNVALLGRTLSSMADMNSDPHTVYTKAQAHAILTVLHTWEKKPALTDAQARLVNAQMTAPLSLTQIKKVAADSTLRGGGGSGGLGGGDRPGSGGFGGGGFRRGGFDPASIPAPRDYNPLNPVTNPLERGRERARLRHAQLIAALMAAK